MPNHNFIDLTRQTFNRLTVLERAENTKWGTTRWRCKCSCGNITTVHANHLKSGATQSCGCIGTELLIERRLIHGMYSTPEYKTWAGIIQRCTNPNEKAFKNYGSRGITVCKEWRKDFMAFFKDMGKRPSPKLTIERVDNNKGYSLENCVWANSKKQANNRRTNHIITIHGWTMNLCQWAEFAGISQKNLSKRINAFGWPPAKAIFTPVRHR
jgi:hypothetical protein